MIEVLVTSITNITSPMSSIYNDYRTTDMTYKIERKRLRNSSTEQTYCLTITFKDGIKIQVPATDPQEAMAQYRQFMVQQA